MRPLVRVFDAAAMSCGWPPEHARLNRAWMPGSDAWKIEALAERWQKNALLLGADQPGKPCAAAENGAT